MGNKISMKKIFLFSGKFVDSPIALCYYNYRKKSFLTILKEDLNMQKLDFNLLLTQVRVDQMFRIIRELNDLTLRDVAVETGHVVSTISKFENGKIKSDELVDFYSKLAKQAGVFMDNRPLEED